MNTLRKISVLLTSFAIVGMPFFNFDFIAQKDPVLFEMKLDNLRGSNADYLKDEIVVKFKNEERYRRIRLPIDETVESALERYKNRSDVAYAEPNYIAHAFMVPNDPYYSYQWNFDNPVYAGIHMQNAWDISNGAGVIVAVIDTGVAYENYYQSFRNRYYLAPDLANTSFVAGYDFVNNDSHPNDDNGHGTHVTGTIAQSTNNNLGVAGIAYLAKIMPIKVLNNNGSGTYADVADGIRWAADHGAKIINLSLGGSSPASYLEDAVAYAYNKGVTIAAASGNDGSSSVSYPAAYDNYVIAVGATRYDETRASYSNYGSSIDLVAPGGDLNVDQNGDGYGDGILQQTFSRTTNNWGYYFYQGTSMAAPHVAGVAALVISKGIAISPAQVMAVLESTADDLGASGRDNVYGYGLVNAASALNWTAGPVDNPPSVSIISPAEGAVVSGTVTITATASDDYGVTKVDFYVDGVLLSSDDASPYEASWDSTSIADGQHTLSATAVDTAGQTATASIKVTVDNVNDPPVANAGSNQSAFVGDTVYFDGSGSSDPDGTIVSYAWNFGDGTTASGVTTSHIYSAADTYTVTLTVTDNGGLTGSDTALVSVSEKPAAVICWSGGNQYLYRNSSQAKKFCKCAEGTYGYKSYNYSRGRQTVYQYVDTGDNENWDVESRSSYSPVSEVTCTDGVVYSTKNDYSYPK